MAAVDVSPEDLSSFHAAHFSTTSSDHFSQHFLGPVEDEYQDEEAEDDLGYYPDGTKRTLTDEQIAIFRHSEIETLLRERRHAKEAQENNSEEEPSSKPTAEEGEIENGEFGESPTLDNPITDTPTSTENPKQSKNRKKKLAQKAKQKKAQQAKEKGFFKQNVKPDLRKRTWDKVEAGLENLDYDEDSAASSALSRPAQRRRISYDDD